MFAMAVAVEAHNLLIANLRVSKTGLYTYPDASALLGEPQFLDGRKDTLLNPALIVEVLSPSTEAYDRGRKSDHYKTIESLQGVPSDLRRPHPR